MRTAGTIYWHYQSEIARLGRAVARATPNDDNSGMTWRVFAASMTDAEIVAEYNAPQYHGPGRFFLRSVCIRRSRSRALATQKFGTDC